MTSPGVRRLPTSLVALVLGAMALSGCGGADTTGSTSEPSAPATSSAAAGSTSSTSSSSAPEVAEAELMAVPAADDGSPGLDGITEFPVPAGSEVESPGIPFSGSWEFSVADATPEEPAAFYLQALPPLGYTVTEDAVITVGANAIEFAAGWSGPAYGTVDPFSGRVVVRDRPADGLSLDGVPVG